MNIPDNKYNLIADFRQGYNNNYTITQNKNNSSHTAFLALSNRVKQEENITAIDLAICGKAEVLKIVNPRNDTEMQNFNEEWDNFVKSAHQRINIINLNKSISKLKDANQRRGLNFGRDLIEVLKSVKEALKEIDLKSYRLNSPEEKIEEMEVEGAEPSEHYKKKQENATIDPVEEKIKELKEEFDILASQKFEMVTPSEVDTIAELYNFLQPLLKLPDGDIRRVTILESEEFAKQLDRQLNGTKRAEESKKIEGTSKQSSTNSNPVQLPEEVTAYIISQFEYWTAKVELLNKLFKKPLTGNLFTDLELLEKEAKEHKVELSKRVEYELKNLRKYIKYEKDDKNCEKKIKKVDNRLRILFELGGQCPSNCHRGLETLYIYCSISTIKLRIDNAEAGSYLDWDNFMDINDSIVSELRDPKTYMENEEIGKLLLDKLRRNDRKVLYFSFNKFSESLWIYLLDRIDFSKFHPEVLDQKNIINNVFCDLMRRCFCKEGEPMSLAPLKKFFDIHPSIKLEDFNTMEIDEWLFLPYQRPKIDFDNYYITKDLFGNDFVYFLDKRRNFTSKYLEGALTDKLSPEIILKIYKKVPNSEFESAAGKAIREQAIRYMFANGSFDVAYDLISSGERPTKEEVEKAIRENKGEYLIKLLSEGKIVINQTNNI